MSMPWTRALLLCFILGEVALAGDWPQWLGPNRDSSSAEFVKPWKGELKVLWRHLVGEGNSAPVVAGGRVYLHSKPKDKFEEHLTAYDAASGEQLWQAGYPRGTAKFAYGNGPRATPAVDGKRVYTFGITGILTCFDADKGKQLWQVDTVKEFKAPRLFFGASCSPLVEKDAVLINVGGKGASVVAFAKDKGNVLWKSEDDGASYSSPIGFGKGDARQVIFLTQQGLVSLNPGNGELRWRFPLKDLLLESSTTPVRAGDLLIASSITVGSVGVNMETKDGKPSVEQKWKNADLTCYFSTPVAVGDHLYMVVGVNPLTINPLKKVKTSASLRCIDSRTGKELWKKPDVGTYHATLLRTGDNKLLMLEEAGDLVLVDPNPEEYRELARSKICGDTWVHPALADGRLYVRDNKELVCVQLGK
jgi:outer membrane protein assembly factor BamB